LALLRFYRHRAYHAFAVHDVFFILLLIILLLLTFLLLRFSILHLVLSASRRRTRNAAPGIGTSGGAFAKVGRPAA
jgi:hypothetical protein